MKKYSLTCVWLILLGSCIFSYDEVIDSKVIGNFYTTSFSGKATLVYKDADDLKIKGGGIVILENIDSIGFDGKEIIATSNENYFIVDTTEHQIRKKYNNYNEFISMEARGKEYFLKAVQ